MYEWFLLYDQRICRVSQGICRILRKVISAAITLAVWWTFLHTRQVEIAVFSHSSPARPKRCRTWQKLHFYGYRFSRVENFSPFAANRSSRVQTFFLYTASQVAAYRVFSSGRHLCTCQIAAYRVFSSGRHLCTCCIESGAGRLQQRWWCRQKTPWQLPI